MIWWSICVILILNIYWKNYHQWSLYLLFHITFRLFLSFTRAFMVFHPRADVSILCAIYFNIYFCPLWPFELRLELFYLELFRDLTSFTYLLSLIILCLSYLVLKIGLLTRFLSLIYCFNFKTGVLGFDNLFLAYEYRFW